MQLTPGVTPGSAGPPIDLKGVFDRLVEFVKASDPSSCTPATVYHGADIPTQCVVRADYSSVPSSEHKERFLHFTVHASAPQGPVFALEIAGSVCTEDPSSGVVTCAAPAVTLTKTPGACNLKYTSADVIQVLRSVCCKLAEAFKRNQQSRAPRAYMHCATMHAARGSAEACISLHMLTALGPAFLCRMATARRRCPSATPARASLRTHLRYSTCSSCSRCALHSRP